jgi:ferredoxin
MMVDKEICIACGACSWAAPDIFDHDEAGRSFNTLDENCGVAKIPNMLLEELDNATERCPSGAIIIAEQSFDGNLHSNLF